MGCFVNTDKLTITAQEDTLLVAILINPVAPLRYQGTIGR